MILQYANSGVELVALFYLVRTLPALNELSRGIDRLSDRLNALDTRIANIESELHRKK